MSQSLLPKSRTFLNAVALIQTLTILDKLHTHNPPIIHRDIKPANLIISSGINGKYKVTVIDFGAVSNPQVQSGGSTIAGTYGFMPPEQLMGQSAPASDIYALAAVAVQLLSGKSPAEMPVKDFRLIFEPELQNQPHELVSLLRQMLEPKVENRLADPSKIILQLNNIRTHQTVHLSQNSKHYSASYNNDLAKVNFIGQNSNIDLWQALPDETPRDIPEFYANIIKQYSNAFEKYIYSFNQTKVDNAENSFKSTRKDAVGCIPVIMILSGMLGPAIAALLIYIYDSIFSAKTLNHIETPMLMGLGYGLGLIICIILALVCLYLWFKYFNAKKMLDLKEKYVKCNPFGLSAIDVADHITNLIKYGRKMIATIASIQYVNQSSDDIEHVQHNPSETDTGGENAVQYIAWRYPVFKILYKFNPPDDERQCNILHSCYVHTDPEKNYKLGDPFPILYMIQNKGVFDAVISMPYPLSDLDLIENDKIVDISTSEGHTNR